MDRKLEKKKWPPKKIAGFSAAGLFFSVALYTFLLGDNSSKLAVEQEKITISEVTRAPFQEFIPVTGNVLPIKTIYIDAIEGGRVEKKFVEAGAFVKEGDKILQLANTNMLLDIMFREAQFFKQSNNLRNTRLLMEQSRVTLRQANIGFVFQSFNLIDELTVYENVELPLLYLGMSAADRRKRVEEVLEHMQIMRRRHRAFDCAADRELSGHQSRGGESGRLLKIRIAPRQGHSNIGMEALPYSRDKEKQHAFDFHSVARH
jgi:energy-coupling factor transporter ATP-binding protein EcfA2